MIEMFPLLSSAFSLITAANCPTRMHRDVPLFWESLNRNVTTTPYKYRQNQFRDVEYADNTFRGHQQVFFVAPEIRLAWRKADHTTNSQWRFLAQYDYSKQSAIRLALTKLWAVFPKNNLITVENVFVSGVGELQFENCTTYLNNGCSARGGSVSINRSSAQWIEEMTSIAALWGTAPWHFPIELFAALGQVDMTLLRRIPLHIPQRTSYTEQWFQLIGIDFQNVVEGTFFAKKLHLPRLGTCGFAYAHQMRWLRNTILSSPIVQLTQTESIEVGKKLIVVIKRNKHRQLANHDAIVEMVGMFANSNGYQVYVHDDKRLPPLHEQVFIFSHASIVIGPHGAGLSLSFAAKQCACIIEFLDMNLINGCYMTLSFVTEMNYFGLPMYSNVGGNLTQTAETLQHCLAARKNCKVV